VTRPPLSAVLARLMACALDLCSSLSVTFSPLLLVYRAREFKFALELKPSHKVCRTYAAAGANNGVEGWGVGTVLYGSVKEWVCQSRKGLRKFRNFEALRAQDRLDRTDYVFVGDTGELDLQAGESMIR